MPNVTMKNLFRFSSLALASVGSILGGHRGPPTYKDLFKILTALKEPNRKSIGNNPESLSQDGSTFDSQSSYQLISSSKFEGISSSIGDSSKTFSTNTLSDSSSKFRNSNPASYYWYREIK